MSPEPDRRRESALEAELVRRARGGGAAELDALCRHLQPELLGYVRRKMGPAARRWDEPEDLVQDVLHEVLGDPRRWPAELAPRELRARLYRTAGSRIVDRLRRHAERRGVSVLGGGAEVARSRTHCVTRADEGRFLRALVERLPESHREVVRLCALEGASFVEASRRIGLPADTLRKRYERARTMLAEKLRERRAEGRDA